MLRRLRAIAATLIVAHHAGFASGDTFRYGWGAYVGRMDIGVPIFFGLSGFLLFRPYVSAQFAGTQPIGNADFWTRRVLRIFPAYWATLFLQVILGGIVVHSLFGLLVYMSLTQIYFMRYVIGAITQSWSLATEMSFYVFLPFWARWMRRLAGTSTINVQAMRLLGWLGGLVCCRTCGGASSTGSTRAGSRSRTTGCRRSSSSSASAWRWPSSRRGPTTARWCADPTRSAITPRCAG